ncbi:hypothetical protein [Bradyrhizobium prioriisuperbiae]|uniref:hypothetical protein n=1 Tax=Bradyrhizobium prioriisuperbiae TaxID=2854389 RepID=UPI0028E45007|nr:hypothetical protein [Bradyrhizobium prioritasuperba]
MRLQKILLQARFALLAFAHTAVAELLKVTLLGTGTPTYGLSFAQIVDIVAAAPPQQE